MPGCTWGHVMEGLDAARQLQQSWPAASRSCERQGVQRTTLVALCLVLACCAFLLSQALGHAPYPHIAEDGVTVWSEVARTASYAFVLLGVVVLPRARLPNTTRARMIVDGLMTASAMAALSWYFVVGPLLLHEALRAGVLAVRAIQPLLDLLLIFSFLVLSMHWRDTALRPLLACLATAMCGLVGIDGLEDYAAVHHTALLSAVTMQLCRTVAYIIIGWAAVLAWVSRDIERPEGARVPSLPPIWRYLLPYALIPLVVTLMIYATATQHDTQLDLGVYVAGATLIELMFVHQFLAYRELMAYTNRSTRLENMAAVDPITGLPNHRTIVAALNQELARSRRYGRACCVLFLDLDHFKALNDTFGHRAGDAALHEFASIVRLTLRATDLLGRWGGEEFVAVLPEADAVEGYSVAERVREAVASHRFRAVGGGHLTCSVGMANFPEDAVDRDLLVERADQAMYAAKRLGRNQVRTAQDTVAEQLHAQTRDDAALEGTVDALVALQTGGNERAAQKSRGVALAAGKLALAAGLEASEARMIEMAGRLLDIGTVTIPDAVLAKRDALSDEEWSIMRRHTEVAASVISQIPVLRVLAPAIRAHHERWDGQGYPDGLAGEGIPIGSRILAVADAFVAMVVARPGRAGMHPVEALAEVKRCAGTQFDPDIVDHLAQLLASDKEICAVVMRGEQRLEAAG